MSKVGRNERLKVTAALLNGAALVLLASGCVAPLLPLLGTFGLGATVAVAAAGASALHLFARAVTLRLED